MNRGQDTQRGVIKLLLLIFSTALLMTNARFVYAACMEGAVVNCTASNGCPGTKECAGGRFTECEAPDSCGIGENDFLTIFNTEGGQDASALFDGKTGPNAFNDQRI